MIILHILIPILYGLPFFFILKPFEVFLQFFIGVQIGFLFFFIDRWLHIFFVDPESDFSKLVKGEWRSRRYIGAVRLVTRNRQLQRKLTTRSALFLLAYIPTALFILTSTGSILGMGLILGLGLHYCVDFLQYRRDMEQFQHHFLWQVRRKFSQTEIDSLTMFFILFFVLITLLMLR